MSATKETTVELEQESSTNTPLSKPEFNKEELLIIFDEILFSGEYKEDVLIKGKLKVTFKSRTAAETSEITKEIDSSSFNLMSALQEQRAFLNLVHSVSSYNGKDLSKTDVAERKSFLGKLPAVVVAALSESLVKFDSKTDAAFREGELNF